MTLEQAVGLTSEELGRICAETKGCCRCEKNIRTRCLNDPCWKHTYPKDNTPPAVYYGFLPAKRPDEEHLEWRKKFFAERGIPEEPMPVHLQKGKT